MKKSNVLWGRISFYIIVLTSINIAGCSPYEANLGNSQSSQISDVGANGSLKVEDFYNSGSNNSLTESESLFDTKIMDGKKVIYTTSQETNIHSHFLGDVPISNYIYTGKMRASSDQSGIGITFFSQYPNKDAYYRLRRYASVPKFHLEHHGGTIACKGDSIGSNMVANTWYNFEVKINALETSTSFEIRLWDENVLEKDAPVLKCVDGSSLRYKSGTIGLWSMGPGEKIWTDLKLNINLISDISVPEVAEEVDTPTAEEPVAENPPVEEPTNNTPPVEETPSQPVSDTPLPTGVYPNATNTGSRIPISQLKPTTLSNIKTPGLYEGLKFAGSVSIDADNVTLRDCYVNGPVVTRAANTRVEYVEIAGNNNAAGFNTNLGFVSEQATSAPFVYRTYIHHFFDLFRPGGKGIEIRDSYLYDWGSPTDGNHADALQFPVWSQTLVAPNKIIISGNTVREPFNGDATAAMGFNSLTSEWIVTNNYFDGSGFMLYISQAGYTLKDNVFSNMKWGAYRIFLDGANYGVWENNRFSNGTIIPPPK